MGKSHILHFPSTETKTTKPLELIHTDLWGPSPTPFRDGYNYYISLVDDFNRYTWIYPLKLKLEALDVFKLFKLQVESQFDTIIKNLQSNWGGGRIQIIYTILKPIWNHFQTFLPLYTPPKWVGRKKK